MAPFSHGIESSSLRKWCEPARLQALLSLRYEVLECAERMILLARNTMPSALIGGHTIKEL